MELKEAQTTDIEPIAALWHEGWFDGHADICPPELAAMRTIDSFRNRVASRLDKTWIAFEEDVAGFFMLEGAEVYQFYVGRLGRGKGVARFLMNEAERKLCEHGVTDAWLACSIGNDRAARFYEKSGWTRARTKTEHVEVTGGTFPVQVWEYTKRLNPSR